MSAQPPSGRCNPFIGLICLLAYLGFATPLIPTVMALAAWIDGDHHVSVAAEPGGTRVVLSHDAADPRKMVSHAHCVVSRAITSIAEQSEPFHPDHVLNFQGTDVAHSNANSGRVAPPVVDAAAIAILHYHFAAHSITPALEAAPPSAPPPAAVSVDIARVTVLLI